MSGLLLGCIADDLTGATDLGLTLVRGGMSVVQVIGAPRPDDPWPDPWPEAEAVVVALKSRTIPAAEAVDLSLRSADALIAAGARQLFFKYCSTFDSTDAGNIGPVAEALLDRVGAPLAVATPAFPANGRTVFRGHLFVGDRLLSESPMRDHPLTPMRDADLVRVLGRQTTRPVGLVAYETVEAGPEAIAAALAAAERAGKSFVVVDALADRHLRDLGRACAALPLLTGGSGLALGLPDNFRRLGLLPARERPPPLPAAPGGRAAILAGSCSAATLRQVAAAAEAGLPALRRSPQDLAEGRQTPEAILAWADRQSPEQPLLIYATATPEEVAEAQARLGRERAAELVERALGQAARGLLARGVTRLVVAGGETSGAVVEALGVRALAIGPEIDPGVPWTVSLSEPRLALALKSGNFGAPDFFLKAWDALP